MSTTAELIAPRASGPLRADGREVPVFRRSAGASPLQRPLMEARIKAIAPTALLAFCLGVAAIGTGFAAYRLHLARTMPAPEAMDPAEGLDRYRQAKGFSQRNAHDAAIRLLQAIPPGDLLFGRAQQAIFLNQREKRQAALYHQQLRFDQALADARASRILFKEVIKSPAYYQGLAVAWRGRVAHIKEADGKTVALIQYRQGDLTNEAFSVTLDGSFDIYQADEVTAYGTVARVEESVTPSGAIRSVPGLKGLHLEKVPPAPSKP